MSRTKSDGLEFFPLDVAFFKDERIRRLSKNFGADGPLFYLYILCRAYSNSFYVEWDRDFEEDAALELHCSIEKIGLMLNYMLSRSLLRDISLGTVKVLSSHGIQNQYQRCVKERGRKRDIVVNAAFWILDDSENEGFIKVRHDENKSGKKAINPGNKDLNPRTIPQSKVNQSKVKQSKNSMPAEAAGGGESDFERFWRVYPKKANKQDAMKAFRGVDVPVERLIEAVEKQMRSTQWQKDGGQFIPYPASWLRRGGWENELAESTPSEEAPPEMAKDVENMLKMYEYMKKSDKE